MGGVCILPQKFFERRHLGTCNRAAEVDVLNNLSYDSTTRGFAVTEKRMFLSPGLGCIMLYHFTNGVHTVVELVTFAKA